MCCCELLCAAVCCSHHCRRAAVITVVVLWSSLSSCCSNHCRRAAVITVFIPTRAFSAHKRLSRRARANSCLDVSVYTYPCVLKSGSALERAQERRGTRLGDSHACLGCLRRWKSGWALVAGHWKEQESEGAARCVIDICLCM